MSRTESREPYSASLLLYRAAKGAGMKIEPIHVLTADELQHGLDVVRERIDFIYTHPETKPKETREAIIKQIEVNLGELAESIKRSLVFNFPQFDYLINDIVDTNETIHATDWARGLYPLYEGVIALQKIYGVLENLFDDPNEHKQMETAIKNYVLIAGQFYHNHKMKSAAPLIEGGRKRAMQIHSEKDKRNKYILKLCREYKIKRKFTSAEHLLKSFPNRVNATKMEGAEVFKEVTEKGDMKAFCIHPNGKILSVGLRAFQKYYDEEAWKKKNLKKVER